MEKSDTQISPILLLQINPVMRTNHDILNNFNNSPFLPTSENKLHIAYQISKVSTTISKKWN